MNISQVLSFAEFTCTTDKITQKIKKLWDDDNNAASSVKKKRLEDLAADRPDECKLYRSQACGSEEYIIPKKWIKISPPRITKMTEEQREFRRLKMKELRAKQLGRI